MVQVKEFINDKNNIDKEINDWIKNTDTIEDIIDIKYSMSNDCSGALVIYKAKISSYSVFENL